MSNEEILQQIENCHENGIPCDFGICAECYDRLNHEEPIECPEYEETLEYKMKALSSEFEALGAAIIESANYFVERIAEVKEYVEHNWFLFYENVQQKQINIEQYFFNKYNKIITKTEREQYLKNSINHNKIVADNKVKYYKSGRDRQQKFYHYVRKARNRL